MKLRPIAPDEIRLVAGWLSDERNTRWLDFGAGRQSLDPVGLRVMTQREIHCLRVFTDEEDVPVGVMALSDVNRKFRTATIWGVLGRKEYGPRDLTVRAAAAILEHGFRELGLEAINAWTVEVNRGGFRLLRRLGFRPVGRQRRAHWIDGVAHDRLWFDLLAEEYHGYEELER